MSALIARRFELRNKLGEGTFAEIWRAADLQAEAGNKNVALKLFRPSAYRGPAQSWQAVMNEIAAGVRMPPHPNVVRAWALTYTRFFSDEETPCLVLDYVQGANLALWLEAQPRPAPENVEVRLQVLTAALRGLAHAHAHKVTHNDLSFGNVLVGRWPSLEAYITDFGCAWTPESAEEERTGNSAEDNGLLQPINPPPYSLTLPFDEAARRDVYAFATLVYLTLAGRHPLSDEWQRMRKDEWHGQLSPHGTLPRRSVLQLAPWAASDPRLRLLSDLLLRCVAPASAARPASAVDVEAQWITIMHQVSGPK